MAEAGLVDTARLLVEAGAQVDFTGKSGETALLAAVRRGEDETVKVLLEKGADLDHKDAEGRFALLEAALNDDIDMINLLVTAGADIERKGTANGLTRGARNGAGACRTRR